MVLSYSTSTKDFENLIARTMATLKQSITRLFKQFSLTSLIYLPCLGLRFHTVNLKCRKIQKTLFTPLIVVNLSSSSILQVEQQKVTVFFPTF